MCICACWAVALIGNPCWRALRMRMAGFPHSATEWGLAEKGLQPTGPLRGSFTGWLPESPCGPGDSPTRGAVHPRRLSGGLFVVDTISPAGAQRGPAAVLARSATLSAAGPRGFACLHLCCGYVHREVSPNKTKQNETPARLEAEIHSKR